MGRDRGDMSLTDILKTIRVRRKKNKGLNAGATTRKKIKSRKQSQELQHILLPNTPPRKRLKKSTLPEHPDCSTQTGINAEVEVALPSPPINTTAMIGLSGDSFEAQEWFQVDGDGNSDDEYILTVTARNSTVTDITGQETYILRVENGENNTSQCHIIPTDSYEFHWTNDSSTFIGKRETFTGPTPGPTFPVTDSTLPLDVFRQMVDNNFIDYLCTETNRHAQQTINSMKQQGKMTPHGRFKRWTDTTREEMYTFMALLILQSLFLLPEEEDYFRFNGFGTLKYFNRIMSYNRYVLVKNMLHFVDNETLESQTSNNRFAKIQPVMDYFNDKFASLYNLDQDVVIDESLLKRQGKYHWSRKITKGKSYELCESSTGYIWKFFLYAGNQTTDISTDDPLADDTTIKMEDMAELTADETTFKNVYGLAEPLLNRGHTIVMDSFYNSPLLARCFKQQKTDCYGKLRLSRESVPSSLRTLQKTDLRQGEVVASYCTDLAVMVWRDANLVSMISTYHDMVDATRQKDYTQKNKPTVIHDYNKIIGGLDRMDQYLVEQPLERVRSRAWYRKLFCRILNVAVFNSFVIFNSNRNRLSHRKFRQLLAEDLIRQYKKIDLIKESKSLAKQKNTKDQGPKPRPIITELSRPFVEHDHFPERSGSTRTRCWLCYRRKRNSRTVWRCIECQVNLCIEGCFREYHKPDTS